MRDMSAWPHVCNPMVSISRAAVSSYLPGGCYRRRRLPPGSGGQSHEGGPVGIPASALDLLTRNQILGGVVSSACFAAISGICILCARRMRNADLKALIPSSGSNVIVVCPGAATRKGRAQVGLMTTEEAMALAEVLQCAGALNKMPSVQ